MANSGKTNERAALEAKRARLEATLNADGNWRALRESSAQGEGDRDEEDRARDARLELLLLANPTFRAWKRVDDAIEALDKSKAQVDAQPSRGSGMSLPPLPLTSSNSPKEVVSLADLSRGIAKLIQRAPPAGNRDRWAVPATRETEEEPQQTHQACEPDAVAAAVFPEAAAEHGVLGEAEPEGEREAEAVVGAEAGAMAEVEIVTHVEPQLVAEAEVELVVETEPEVESETTVVPTIEPMEFAASTAAPRAAPAGEPQSDRPADRPWMVAGERARDEATVDDSADDTATGPEQEATVTFVARDPPASRRATASSQAYDPDAEGAGEVSYPLGAEIDEAQVTILKGEKIEERRQADLRDGNLRRFRRALLGD